MSEMRLKAQELANRGYIEIVIREQVDDDEYYYVAITPELEGCIAQGLSLSEAKQSLAEIRVDYIDHLLSHNLDVPAPVKLMEVEDSSEIMPKRIPYPESDTNSLTIDAMPAQV